MGLKQTDLGVTDVPATVAMFETYFGLRAVGEFPADETMAFLRNDTDALISLFRVKDPVYPESFQVGFIQDDVPGVTTLHERWAADGVEPEAARGIRALHPVCSGDRRLHHRGRS